MGQAKRGPANGKAENRQKSKLKFKNIKKNNEKHFDNFIYSYYSDSFRADF